MKIRLWFLGYLVLALGLAGCAAVKRVLPLKPEKQAVFPAYSGPKVNISVADFDIKAAKATAEVCAGLREVLLSALLESKRFNLVDRRQTGQDLTITTIVREFEPQASGGRSGLGGGGGVGSSRFGGLLGASPNKAHIILEIRVVDTSNSEIVAVGTVQGQASDIEQAIRVCIVEAVRFISQGIPATYYKYTNHGKT